MTDWRPMSEAPLDGTEVIGLGYPPDLSVNVKAYGPDVRLMKAWELRPYGTDLARAHAWVARNDFHGYTVGFQPVAWLPKPKEANV